MFKNTWEPVFHFTAPEARIKFRPKRVGHESGDCFDYSRAPLQRVFPDGDAAGLECPVGYEDLWWSLCNTPPDGSNVNIRYMELYPGLDIMDTPSVAHALDEDLIDRFVGTLVDSRSGRQLMKEMKAFHERHISSARLSAMAIMGVPAGLPAPWIFLSMLNLPAGAIPVPGPALDGQQFAQMLAPMGTTPGVVPEPHPNNLNPTTCKNAAVSPNRLPTGLRKGSSTAPTFHESAANGRHHSASPCPDRRSDEKPFLQYGLR